MSSAPHLIIADAGTHTPTHTHTGVIRPPELAIVTEFMELGSLHDVLHNGGANLAALNWAAAVAMLRYG